MPSERVVEDPIYFTPYTRLRKAEQIAQRFFGTSYVADGASGLLLARIVDSRAGRFVLPRRWAESCAVESFSLVRRLRCSQFMRRGRMVDG